MGPVNRDLVLQHHSARDHVIALLAAIGDRAVVARPEAPLKELARLTAMQWSWELTAREFRTMHWPLREHAAQSEQRAGEAHRAAQAATAERDAALERLRDAEARLARAEEAAAAMRASRAWRIAALGRRARAALRRR